jgi:DNA-nicking Smr family endonuclease
MNDDERDKALFTNAMRGVRRNTTPAPRPSPPKPRAEARFTRADQHAVLEESLTGEIDSALLESGDELNFRRPHVPNDVLRRLRRGEYTVDAEIDLHGLTAIEARSALSVFMGEALARHMSCVRIVHGKGRRSGHRGPVLKNVVNLWLRRTEPVLAFGSARPNDGGTGAVYVLLQR